MKYRFLPIPKILKFFKNFKNIFLSVLVLILSIILVYTSYLVKNQKEAKESKAASVLIDWNPAWNSDWGAAKQPARPPITSWITLQKDAAGDTLMMRDGKEFVVMGTGVNNASDAIGANSYMTDADMKATIRRIASLGHNTLRIMGQCTKYMGSSTASNYGCWAGATGPAMSEAYLSAMDREIAYANQLGLQVWFVLYTNNAAGSSYLARAYPNLPVVSNNYYGMQWSDIYRKYFKEFASKFTDRVNTVTGVRYIDNPGIIWQTDNEAGFSYAYFSSSRAGYMDGLITADENTNPWTKELHTKTRNYFSSRGWTLPGNKFPLHSTYNGWNSTDKSHLMSFISDTEEDYAREMSQWLKSKNSKVLVDVATFNYQSGEELNYSDLSTHHNYSRTPSGDPISGSYGTRTSTLKDNNGFNWSWALGGSRLESTPYVQTETGDYGLNRWDYERDITEAILQNLQKTSGFVVFNESQALDQAKASGIQFIHHHPGWPSRELSVMLAAPIMEHRLISPLPAKFVGVYSPSEYLSQQVSQGKASISPWFFQSNSDGSERGYWKGRIYMGFGTGSDVGTYPKVTDTEFANGYHVPTVAGEQIYVSTKGVTVSTPYVAGLVNDLKNTTIGPMTLSNVSPMENAVVMIRSDAKYPLFSGQAKLFVHSHSTVTNAPGFSLTTDGATVTGWGSPSNTRLVVPSPFTITFNTGGKALNILGVNDDGTTVTLQTTFDGTSVRFTTDTRFPLYIVSPKSGTVPTTTFGPSPTSGFTPTPYRTPTPTRVITPTGSLSGGDINHDGRVDILDFQLLSNSFGKSSGQTGYNSNADFNHDNTINILDFQILSNNFGRTITSTNTPTPRLSSPSPTRQPTPLPTIPGGIGTTTVANWKNNAVGAIVLSYDDSWPSHMDIAVPEMSKRGIVGTFYLNPGNYGFQARKTQWQQTGAAGVQELANHTMTHSGASDYTDAVYEIGMTAETIWSLRPAGSSPIQTFASGGATSWNITSAQREEIMSKFHVIGRSMSEYDSKDSTANNGQNLKNVVDNVKNQRTKLSILFHCIHAEGGDNCSLTTNKADYIAFLDYLQPHIQNGSIWSAGRAALYMYENERDTASVRTVSATSNRIEISLTSTKQLTHSDTHVISGYPNVIHTNTPVFNEPLTLITNVPDGWSSVRVTQGTNVKNHTSGNGRLMYDAIPGTANIILTPQ